MTTEQLADWTQGAARLVLRSCDVCGNVWYLPHENCPLCSSQHASSFVAGGFGLCVAVTRLHVTAQEGDSSPIGLALVELDEGPLVMGRVHGEVEPGDCVQVDFRKDDHEQALVPSFSRKT